MKKLTNNTFEGGLMLDTHPLTTPNNVLTDALNATLITMNGNEGILQNDMGNGRVESAFLPPGYVPVGMKEYGGIIYVASYNPVTNKSQIGSFPSPERNIDLTEVGDRGTTLKLLWDLYERIFKNDKFNKNGYNVGIGGFTNKVQIFDKVIRSGDKFGLYFDSNGNNLTTYLSNYFNYVNKTRNNWDNENNVYKNDIITLSIQVLDANNNLRDITPQLKRYDNNNKLINFDDETSELDKFNSGYFINGTDTAEMSSVDVERNKRALNTYNNKLFGKLFLTGVVNVIDHIESYVRFVREDSNSIKAEFIVSYYYNCKEKYLTEPILYYYTENNENLLSNTTNTISYGNNTNLNSINESVGSEVSESKSYDPITNLYKVNYIITINNLNSSLKLFYIIVPRMKNLPRTNSVSKLTHIATEGYVDLSKIGTGFEKINEWRYRYLGDYMLLNLGLEYYPLEDDKLSNLCLTFYDWSKTNVINDNTYTFKYTFSNKISYNGTFTTYLNFNDYFKYGHLYVVKITINENDEDKLLGYRLLISSEIYNDLFQTYYDYCDKTTKYDGNTTAYDAIYNKNKVKLNLDIKESNYTSSGLQYDSYKNLKLNIDDNLYEESDKKISNFSKSDDRNTYSIINFYKVITSENLNIDFEVPKKFPFNINNSDNLLYNIEINLNIDNNKLKIGLKDLPILDNKLDSEVSIPKSKYDIKNNNSTITITNTYFIQSELVFNYENNQKYIYPTYTYKKIIDYIYELLEGVPFITPVVAMREDNSTKYIDLLKCYPGGSPTALYNTREENETVELLNEKNSEGASEKFISNFLSKINKWTEEAALNTKNFCVIASPIQFGWNVEGININQGAGTITGTVNYGYVHDKLLETLHYGSDDVHVDINFHLREYDKVGDEDELRNNPDDYCVLKWYYWAGLLWKNKNNDFVIVNSIYAHDLTTSTSFTANFITYHWLISNMLNSINNIYFKLNNISLSYQVYKIDNNNITYTPSYIVNISNNITLNNIRLSELLNKRIFQLNDKSNGGDVILKQILTPEQVESNTVTPDIQNGLPKSYEVNHDEDGNADGTGGNSGNTRDVVIVKPPITGVDKLDDIDPVDDDQDDPSEEPDENNPENENKRYVAVIDLNTRVNTMLNEFKLSDFLMFEIDTNSSNVYKTRESQYQIPEISLQLDESNYGILEVGNDYYFTDFEQNQLTKDFYLFNNNLIVPIELILLNNVRNFINRLTIDDNNLLIKSHSGVGTSKLYGFSASDPPAYNIHADILLLKIGECKYIDLPLLGNKFNTIF